MVANRLGDDEMVTLTVVLAAACPDSTVSLAVSGEDPWSPGPAGADDDVLPVSATSLVAASLAEAARALAPATDEFVMVGRRDVEPWACSHGESSSLGGLAEWLAKWRASAAKDDGGESTADAVSRALDVVVQRVAKDRATQLHVRLLVVAAANGDRAADAARAISHAVSAVSWRDAFVPAVTVHAVFLAAQAPEELADAVAEPSKHIGAPAVTWRLVRPWAAVDAMQSVACELSKTCVVTVVGIPTAKSSSMQAAATTARFVCDASVGARTVVWRKRKLGSVDMGDYLVRRSVPARALDPLSSGVRTMKRSLEEGRDLFMFDQAGSLFCFFSMRAGTVYMNELVEPPSSDGYDAGSELDPSQVPGVRLNELANVVRNATATHAVKRPRDSLTASLALVPVGREHGSSGVEYEVPVFLEAMTRTFPLVMADTFAWRPVVTSRMAEVLNPLLECIVRPANGPRSDPALFRRKLQELYRMAASTDPAAVHDRATLDAAEAPFVQVFYRSLWAELSLAASRWARTDPDGNGPAFVTEMVRLWSPSHFCTRELPPGISWTATEDVPRPRDRSRAQRDADGGREYAPVQEVDSDDAAVPTTADWRKGRVHIDAEYLGSDSSLFSMFWRARRQAGEVAANLVPDHDLVLPMSKRRRRPPAPVYDLGDEELLYAARTVSNDALADHMPFVFPWTSPAQQHFQRPKSLRASSAAADGRRAAADSDAPVSSMVAGDAAGQVSQMLGSPSLAAFKVADGPGHGIRPTGKTSRERPSRRTIDVQRNEDGTPQLPLRLGVITIHDLGRIVADRPGWHTERYIWPLGFRSTRRYASMKHMGSKTLYTCEICDGGDVPEFRIHPEDDPETVFTGPSATSVWTAVVRNLTRIKTELLGDAERKTVNISGPEYFGLANPTVSQLIQELPDADKCEIFTGAR